MIRFVFDFLSPYAYLAFHALPELAGRHGRQVEYVPVLFAGLLKHHGQKAPAEIPAKRVYVFKDCLRTAAKMGLPLHPPPSHPFNPLHALRVAGQAPASIRRGVIEGLFAAVWQTGEGVHEPAVVERIARERGMSAEAIAAASTPEGKGLLRENTGEALRAGVFGVPTMLVDGDLFWGLDSFEHLDGFLSGADPVPVDLLSVWQHVRPGATR